MAATYRAGNHHGVTIVREGDGARCGRPDHDCDRGHLAAVVIDGGDVPTDELATRIAFMLNEGPIVDDAIALLNYALYLRQYGEHAPGGGETWAKFDRRCEEFLRRVGVRP